MINLSWQNSKNRQEFVKILKSEGIIAGSTDTVQGLFAPLTITGYTQLNEIKQRNNKPYLVMVANFDKALSFVDTRDHEKLTIFAQKYWPGPVTLICNAHKNVPDYIAPNGKIALRVPDNTYLQEVLEHFDGLFSTSANIAGEDIPTSTNKIDKNILKQIAAVIDSNGKNIQAKPSTIFDITTDDLIEVRR